MHDLIVVGGGASGMAAAVCAARRGLSVLILEKNPALGKKIYATGNGRCNITNTACENAADVLAFFRSIGIEIVEREEGRMYPGSFQAGDVVFMLKRAIDNLGVACETSFPVSWMEKKEGFFVLSDGSREYAGRNVLIATGGKAAPKFGTVGDGYALAQTLGHKTVKPIPVLTAIECEGDFSSLKGVRVRALCSLIKGGESVFKEQGEVQFTDYGLSGIVIFNMSRYLLLDDYTSFSDYEIHLDFSDGRDIKKEFMDRLNIDGMRGKDLLRSIVPEALATDIVRKTFKDMDSSVAASSLTEEVISGLENNIRCWRVTTKGAKGWQMAQCTKGGVSYEEVNRDTMESLLVPGLFFAGEVLDYDGPCGGFNLNHAWVTGIRAGNNV